MFRGVGSVVCFGNRHQSRVSVLRPQLIEKVRGGGLPLFEFANVNTKLVRLYGVHALAHRPERRDTRTTEGRLVDLELAPVALHDPTDDGESKADATGRACSVRLLSKERRDDLLA